MFVPFLLYALKSPCAAVFFTSSSPPGAPRPTLLFYVGPGAHTFPVRKEPVSFAAHPLYPPEPLFNSTPLFLTHPPYSRRICFLVQLQVTPVCPLQVKGLSALCSGVSPDPPRKDFRRGHSPSSFSKLPSPGPQTGNSQERLSNFRNVPPTGSGLMTRPSTCFHSGPFRFLSPLTSVTADLIAYSPFPPAPGPLARLPSLMPARFVLRVSPLFFRVPPNSRRSRGCI